MTASRLEGPPLGHDRPSEDADALEAPRASAAAVRDMLRRAVIIALVLLSAFLYALWNALLRLEDDKDRALMAAVVVATLFAAAVAGVRWELGAAPFASLSGVGFFRDGAA